MQTIDLNKVEVFIIVVLLINQKCFNYKENSIGQLPYSFINKKPRENIK